MIDRFSKNLLGFIFQFVDGPELLRLEHVSRKVSAGARQDYVWRYLVENTLEMCQKFYLDSWKQCYWRNRNAADHMTPKSFNYQMCPIRHFKGVVTHLESVNNFVIAADETGVVGVFLVDERDMENDEETLKTLSFETEGVEFMKLVLKTMELIIFTKTAKVMIFRIEQTSQNSFTCEQVRGMDLPLAPLKLYIAQLDEEGALFFVSNMPLASEEFQKDQTILILNIQTMSPSFHQVLGFNEEHKDPIQDFYNTQSLQWRMRFNQPQQHQITLSDLHADLNKYQLATFNGQRLIFSLFTKSLVVVDTGLSKTEIFLRKGNYWMADPFAEDAEGPAINMKHQAGLLITHNISQINVMDYATVAILQKIPISQDAWSLMKMAPGNTLVAISFVQNEILIQKFKIEVKSKAVGLIEEKRLDETHKINDMDMNRYLLASATTEGNVKLRRLNHLDQDPYFINAGSKTIKTNIPHPQKPGVSMVKADQSKIIAVLGNVIRVYSFDIKRKRKA